MDDRPIGMFDSGFGGLTVAKALTDLLPSEDLIYVGDSGRYPYGPRNLDEVRSFAAQITRKLVDTHDVKLVVVACNTATAAALEMLRYDFDVPLVGVVDPGVRALLSVTRTGRVGVIGTVGAIGSGAYERAVRARRSLTASGLPVALVSAACPGLVELVERGQTRGAQARQLTDRLLAPVAAAGIDSLLLGCTHYPYLARTIGEVMGPMLCWSVRPKRPPLRSGASSLKRVWAAEVWPKATTTGSLRARSTILSGWASVSSVQNSTTPNIGSRRSPRRPGEWTRPR